MGFAVVVPPASIATSPIPATSPTAPVFSSQSPFFQRSLRNRKPIQVNPYALEEAKYKMTMKAGGLKPIRIREAQEEAARGRTSSGEDSQDREFIAPSDEDSQDNRRRRTQVSPKSSSLSTFQDSTEAELPDIIGRHGHPASQPTTGQVSKRRKIGHTYSKKSKNHLPVTQPSSPPFRTPARPLEQNRDIYDFLPSPSPSRPLERSLKRRDTNKDTEERPLPSSGTLKRVGLLSLLDDEESDDDSELGPRRYVLNSSPRSPPIEHLSRRTASPTASSLRVVSASGSPVRHGTTLNPHLVRSDEEDSQSTGSSDSDKSGSDSGQSFNEGPSKVVNRFRKIGTHGVLPASYIRLAKQPIIEEPPRTQRSPTAPRSPAQRPGVARTTISSRPHDDVANIFSDDSGNSSDEPMLTASRPSKSKRTVSELKVIDLLDDGDIPEDNRIDYGLPSRSRKRSGATTRKKQTRLTGVTRTSTRTRSTAEGRPRRLNKSTGGSRLRSSTGPRLGIVDAIDHLKRSSGGQLPQFARIAARSASLLPNLGRHSPSSKLIVLETAEDTRRVDQTLCNWREGTLPFKPQDHPRRRPMGSSQQLSKARAPLPNNNSRPTVSRAPKSRETGPRAPRQQASGPRSSAPRTSAPWERQPTLLSHFQSQSSPRHYEPWNPRDQHGRQPGIHTYSQRESNQARESSQRSRAPRSNIDFADFLQRRASRPEKLGGESARNQYLSSTPRQPIGSLDRTQPPERPPARKQTFRRKKTPVRIDADTAEHRQPPPEALELDDCLPEEPTVLVQTQSAQLSGLLPYGSKYSLNFDTSLLKPGTIFNSELFIGNGLLERVLFTEPARVSALERTISFKFLERSLHWGVYDDSMVTQFETIIGLIGDAAEVRSADGDDDIEARLFEARAYSFYSFVIEYIANVLTFHDPLDVISFSRRILQALENCCDRLYLDQILLKRIQTKLALRANAFCLVIAFQIQRLCSSQPDYNRQLELPRIVTKIGRMLVGRLARSGFEPIRNCYEDQRRRSQFEHGIKDEWYVVEMWVIAIQIIDAANPDTMRFWDILNTELHIDSINKSLDIKWFEKIWRAVFTLLPLYQFDNSGVSIKISERNCTEENWAMIKALIDRPLKVYNSNQKSHKGTINDYLRIMYARCHHLITKWCWKNPDTVIPVLYEFFASNGLSNVRNEEDRGAPDFLYNLDKTPSLEVRESDRCFHILLKIIAAGIHRMRATSPGKKIRGLVFRLMPNHRRQYPKDKDLRVEHLAALRNHHDLLETLWWAAPPEYRPPFESIRVLVDPEVSHRHACNVAVRAWSNLIRFQLHSGEGLGPIKESMSWFDYLVEKVLGQHHAARSEAEKQFRLAKETGDKQISENQVEDNIRQNQRQVEGILNDLVKSLCLSMSSVRGQPQIAMALLTKSASTTLFNSFTRVSPRLVLEVLSLVQEFVASSKKVVDPNSAQQQSAAIEEDDSQDFGDWSALEDFARQDDDEKKAAEHLLSIAYGSLFHLLSNCFGADRQPEETLLLKVVDTWCEVAVFLVKNGLKSWSSYLDYGSESWSTLRDTSQTRQFTSYFMPKMIQAGEDVYASNKNTFLCLWMRSLVERESTLKFQNIFTSTILNSDSDNPLLSNTPFSRDRDGVFVVSQLDFRMRRLSLISTVLEKMRETYENVSGNTKALIKVEYADMLKSLMQAMRTNYEELQSNTVSGAYVEFAHRIIEYLQQYTTSIVDIDRYFTDSTSFPVPAGDPDYVVGRLKRYTPKLSRPGTQKELNVFLQTLCERVALSNGHDGMVGQLTTAISTEFEEGNPDKPTLRAYFLHAIFPAYFEMLFKHRSAWVVGIPLLRALVQVMSSLKLAIDSTSFLCAQSVWSMLETTMDSIRSSASQALSLHDAFSAPYYIGALTLVLNSVTAAIPLIYLLFPPPDPQSRVIESVKFLLRFAHYARKAIVPAHQRDEAGRPLDILAMSAPPPGAFSSGRAHAQNTLLNSLQRNWINANGETAFMQGSIRRAVSLPIVPGEGGLERHAFALAVRELLSTAARTELFETEVRSLDAAVWEFEGRMGRPLGDADGVQDSRSGRTSGPATKRACRELTNLFI
ncbi:Mus7/MMS22 family-domain-containing protein [Geopyxis carbonaria]|nr:Mus7/MMS22 family-domain-containing protein [Geopyxis carbonaria]